MREQFIFSELEMGRLTEVLALVQSTFLEFVAPDYSGEGIQEFMRFIKPEAIKEMLSEDKMRIWTCDCDGRVAGVLAAGSGHIHLLFVSSRHHRKGIARQLLNMMVAYYRPPEITVNSSPYALEAYRKLGFADTGREQVVNGLRFTPMKCIML